MSEKKFRAWRWTLFNYDDAMEEHLQKIHTKSCVSRWIYGHELCPKTGKPHLQGYTRWKTAKDGPAATRWLGCKDIRTFPCTMSDEVNARYCSKEGREMLGNFKAESAKKIKKVDLRTTDEYLNDMWPDDPQVEFMFRTSFGPLEMNADGSER